MENWWLTRAVFIRITVVYTTKDMNDFDLKEIGVSAMWVALNDDEVPNHEREDQKEYRYIKTTAST